MTSRIGPAILFVCAILFVGGAAHAQHAGHGQPYAGMEARPIKALSPEQMADLRAGRGMGLALAAELNGYPGPVHVLELAEKLELTAEQRQRTDALRHAMTAETVALGAGLIDLEAELDRQFAARTATRAALERMTMAIGEAQARLRAAHLGYHLTMVEVLSAAQVARYGELRGYAAGPGHGPKH